MRDGEHLGRLIEENTKGENLKLHYFDSVKEINGTTMVTIPKNLMLEEKEFKRGDRVAITIQKVTSE